MLISCRQNKKGQAGRTPPRGTVRAWCTAAAAELPRRAAGRRVGLWQDIYISIYFSPDNMNFNLNVTPADVHDLCNFLYFLFDDLSTEAGRHMPPTLTQASFISRSCLFNLSKCMTDCCFCKLSQNVHRCLFSVTHSLMITYKKESLKKCDDP